MRRGRTVEWVDTAFDTIFVNLAGGQFDAVASATTITPEREEMVRFTVRYYRAQQALVINESETPGITSTADLGQGDTFNPVLQELIDDGTYQQIYDEWFPDAPAGSVAAAWSTGSIEAKGVVP